MVEITGPQLLSFSSGVEMRFNQALQAAPQTRQRITMDVGSTTRENVYPRMDDLPGLREWIGDRVVHSLSAGSYAVRNRTWEMTIGIDREDLEDDQFGLFTPATAMIGSRTAEFPEILVWGLLARGHLEYCYDGQYFFDTDHVSYDANGVAVSVANVATGGGAPWYLFSTRQPLKPMLYQTRRPFVLTPKVALTDENVFKSKRFEWGVDGRSNAGFGLWQTAFRSTQALTADNYAAARTAMGALRRPDGAPLGIVPDLLVVPASLEAAGRALLKGELNASLGSNVWKDTAELLVVPYL